MLLSLFKYKDDIEWTQPHRGDLTAAPTAAPNAAFHQPADWRAGEVRRKAGGVFLLRSGDTLMAPDG